jgi:hypothetical protein
MRDLHIAAVKHSKLGLAVSQILTMAWYPADKHTSILTSYFERKGARCWSNNLVAACGARKSKGGANRVRHN